MQNNLQINCRPRSYVSIFFWQCADTDMESFSVAVRTRVAISVGKVLEKALARTLAKELAKALAQA